MLSRKESALFPRLPFAFLWLAILLLPVAQLSIGGNIPMYWSELAIGGSFLVFILSAPRQAVGRLGRLFREESPFFLFTGLFLVGIVLAHFLNPHSFSDWGEIKSFYFVPVLFLIAILLHAETKEHIESLAFSWFLGLSAASFAGAIASMAGWLSYDGRLTSLYLSPNYLAMLVAPGVLLSMYFFATRFEYRYRGMALFSGGLILFTLWATHSYAAWVAVLIALGAGTALWRVRGSRSHVALLFLIVIILGAVLLQEERTEKWQHLVSGSERSSLASRLMIWQVALKITKDSFPIGIGSGRFQRVYLENQTNFPTYLEWAVPTPHNLYLHFLLEGGVMTLAGWLGCVFIVLRSGFRAFRREPGNRLLILGFVLTTFYLVYGLVDTPYMKNDLALAVWGSLGLFLGALRVRA